MLICASGIEFHYASGVSYRFDTGKCEHDADEAGPVLRKRSVQRLQMTERFTEMWQTAKPQRDHDERSRTPSTTRAPACAVACQQGHAPYNTERITSAVV